MQTDERDDRVFVDFSHSSDAAGAAWPDDEGMPHAGAAPADGTIGEDAGDAARRAAGADPAADRQEPVVASLAGALPPAD
ncbi:MAG: hypothetical protein U0075_21670 [Thermomicrobiales bacterium]